MRGNNANLHNFDRRITTQRRYKPGERMFGPSPVAADSGDPAFTCEYMYVQANETLNPGEVVKLVTSSLDTVSAVKVEKTANASTDNYKAIGVVPEGLTDEFGRPETEVASGSYFWLVVKGVVKILDAGTAAAGNIITTGSTAGKVTSGASSAGELSIGLVLVAKDPAGLTICLFKSPLV